VPVRKRPPPVTGLPQPLNPNPRCSQGAQREQRAVSHKGLRTRRPIVRHGAERSGDRKGTAADRWRPRHRRPTTIAAARPLAFAPRPDSRGVKQLSSRAASSSRPAAHGERAKAFRPSRAVQDRKQDGRSRSHRARPATTLTVPAPSPAGRSGGVHAWRDDENRIAGGCRLMMRDVEWRNATREV